MHTNTFVDENGLYAPPEPVRKSGIDLKDYGMDFTIEEDWCKPFFNVEEKQHLKIIAEILCDGYESRGRNAVTKSLFQRSMTFDVQGSVSETSVSMNLPMSTTAGTMLTGVVEEFKSFVIRGETNSKFLEEAGVNIWKANTAETDGVIGPAYGHNYRNYGGTYDDSGRTRDGLDQIQYIINELKTNPNSRRLVVLNYDPRVNDECVLYPCQMMFQFYVDGNGLSIMAYNRSSDICCAGMWNTAFATLMLGYVAANTGLKPHKVIVTFGNVHVYDNQMTIAAEHISRVPCARFPKVTVTTAGEITIEHIDKDKYYPRLKYPMTA